MVTTCGPRTGVRSSRSAVAGSNRPASGDRRSRQRPPRSSRPGPAAVAIPVDAGQRLRPAAKRRAPDQAAPPARASCSRAPPWGRSSLFFLSRRVHLMALSRLHRLLKKSRPLSRSAQRRTLTLEALEDRTVLSFLPPVTFPVGVHPRAVTVADFNNDGKPDLAVVNAGPSSTSQSSLSVLLGNGNGSFQPAVTTNVLNSGLGHRQRRVGGGGRLQRRPPARRRPEHRRPRGPRGGSPAGQRRRLVPAEPPDPQRRPDPPLRGGRRLRPQWRPRPGDGEQPAAPSACCWATATAPSGPGSTWPSAGPRARSRSVTSTATAGSTWRRRNNSATPSACCWATATARSRGPWSLRPAARNFTPSSLAVGDVNGDGRPDLVIKSSRW